MKMKILKMGEPTSYNAYNAIIFDHMPKLKYEKINSDYMALIKDSEGNIISYDLLAYDCMSNAFAGRELKLSMVDGTTERVKNHWWSSSAEHNHYDKSILHDEKFVSVGCSTVTNLRKCFVFTHYNISEKALNKMIEEYLKHDRFYTYKELEEWAKMQYTWFPIKVGNKTIPYMINKHGNVVEMYTKKHVYPVTNKMVYKNKSDLLPFTTRHIFELKDVPVDGSRITVKADFIEICKSSLPYAEKRLIENCGLKG
jgi:hypothetical protein